jgi:hypothetical protein
MGLPDKAVDHFMAASRAACRPVTKQLAVSEAALCLLDEGREGCLVRALELMKQEEVGGDPPATRGHMARYNLSFSFFAFSLLLLPVLGLAVG